MKKTMMVMTETTAVMVETTLVTTRTTTVTTTVMVKTLTLTTTTTLTNDYLDSLMWSLSRTGCRSSSAAILGRAMRDRL